MMKSTLAYIGLGSNLANPQRQIQRACRALAVLPDSRLLRCSAFYRSRPLQTGVETGPHGAVEQPDYINAVAAVETGLTPLALLDALLAIERDQGRVRDGHRWGARTLDLDILLYGQEIIIEPRLTVPHPGMAEREFVLYPLAQIAPRLVLPDGRPLSDLLAKCPLRGMQQLDPGPERMDDKAYSGTVQ